MRRSLFADFENPFARLVNAVQHEIPKIESESVSPALVELARHCLLKPAKTRLQLVSWELFEHEPTNLDGIAELKSRIVRRTLSKGGIQKLNIPDAQDTESRLDEYLSALQGFCRLECVENREIFPPVEIYALQKEPNTRHFIIQFDPSKTHGLLWFLRIEVCVQWVDANSAISEVRAAALFSPSAFERKKLYAQKHDLLHKGIYAPDAVRRSVVTALYRALDGAQAHVETDCGRKKPKGAESFWRLDLAEPQMERKVS
jgi:hypothetical protein